ncbi:MAG: SGNH/GDSL hydrolase family protein [Lentisphaeria bacterium]
MSKAIQELDPNFRRAEIGGRPMVFADALAAPFALSGFAWYGQEAELCRLPRQIMDQASEGLQGLAWHTSGGMIRFRSDSAAIAIRAGLRHLSDMSHMTRNGSSGFDLYQGAGQAKSYAGSFMPDQGASRLEGILHPCGSGLRDWTVYLPLYTGVETVEIGLDPNSRLAAPTPFAVEKPLLFYGSSITQGGCASRTGNAYAHFLGRFIDAPVVNLGFSGNGRGEPMLAEAIAGLEMAAFILDYDHNAPDPAHLQATHEPFFRIIRNRQPELPVIMLSKCDFRATDEDRRRREIIRQTWRNAVDRGDRQVGFIDGETLFGHDCRDACTVDGCHPNDLGFFRLAKSLLPVLQQALGLPQSSPDTCR